MSYYPNQGGYGQPPPVPPHPSQGYGAPPPGPPPGQQWGAPPGQGYGQQTGWGNQNQYPAGAGYQQPPPGQWGQAPPGPPPPQWQAAPQPGWQNPPPGPPPPQFHGQQQQWQQQGQQQGQYQQYNAPPAGNFPPTPATLGYDMQLLQTHRMDMKSQAEALRKSMKGLGTDEKALIKVLAKLDPVQVNAVREDFNRMYQRDLVSDIKSETSGYFEKGLVAIVRGPLFCDVHNLREAIKGAGTNEAVLNDVLMGRSNADITAIKEQYQRTFARTLESDLRGDLSAATEQLFVMVISARRAEDAAPVIPHEVQQSVTDLQQAFGNMVSKNPVLACQILTSKNDAQLRAIAQEYQNRFSRSLLEELKSTFSGHMEDALILLVARAQNRAASDATQLEDSMAGFGTKDELLVQRVVRAHWNQQHMDQVKREYQAKYKKDLVSRIKGETRSDYQRLMVACVE